LFPLSRFPFPVSRFPFPVSRFPFPCFPFPVSRFPFPVSRFPFPVSRHPFPVTRFPSPAACRLLPECRPSTNPSVPAALEFVPVRGLSYHLRIWEPSVQTGTHPAPTSFMVHGWMDVSASFQFLVDCLAPEWR
jgi:hypothetical protein